MVDRNISSRLRYPSLPRELSSEISYFWSELIRALEHRDLVLDSLQDPDEVGIEIDGGSSDVPDYRVQIRRDSISNWTSNNPVLLEGELGYELEIPNKFKFGDGINAWNDLPDYQGSDGSTILFGGSDPLVGQGKDGDLFIQTTSQEVWAKSSGTWSVIGNLGGPTGATGPTGPTGATGPAGLSIYSGSGVPSPSLGNDGEKYIDQDTGDLYLKTTGSWSVIGNLTGPQGPAGESSTILIDEGVPSSGLGSDGDIYIDSLSSNIYQKIGGSWILQGNLSESVQGASFTYNLDNTINVITRDDSTTATFSYSSGRVSTIVDSRGFTKTFNYDISGRLLNITVS